MLVPGPRSSRVGALDESLFAYAEDVDWSLRARDAGSRSSSFPPSVVRHRVSAATGGASSPDIALLRPPQRARRCRARCAARSARRLVPAGRGRCGLLRPGAWLAVAPWWAPCRRCTRSATPARSPRTERRRSDWPASARIPGSGSCCTCAVPATGGATVEGRAPSAASRVARSTRAGCCPLSSRDAGARRSRRGRACSASAAGAAFVCGVSRSVLVDLYAEEPTTLVGLVGEDAFRALRIAEINSIGRMHPFLAEAPGLTSTPSTRRKTSSR